jgi:hypothetical protein
MLLQEAGDDSFTDLMKQEINVGQKNVLWKLRHTRIKIFPFCALYDYVLCIQNSNASTRRKCQVNTVFRKKTLAFGNLARVQ